jgi:hypothetical protein
VRQHKYSFILVTILKINAFRAGPLKQNQRLASRPQAGAAVKSLCKGGSWVKMELQRRMHQPIPEQGKWLKQVVAGYFRHFAVPTNIRALKVFRDEVIRRWRQALRRRSQKARMTWTRIAMLADYWLPRPRILHPWPNQRFAVTHPR